MAARLVDLDRVHSDSSKLVGQPVGCALDLPRMIRIRADRRDAEKILETRYEVVKVILSV